MSELTKEYLSLSTSDRLDLLIAYSREGDYHSLDMLFHELLTERDLCEIELAFFTGYEAGRMSR